MNQLEALWELQEAEVSLAKLKKEVKSTPARQKRAKLRSFLTEQQNNIDDIQKNLASKNTQLDSFSAQLAGLMRDYELEKSELDIMENDEESTAAELSEARKSIEKLLEKINALSKELNSTLRFVEKAAADITNTYAKAGKAKREYDALGTVCEAELEDFRPRLEAAEGLVAEKRKTIPDSLMRKYAAIRKNHALPVARVEHEQCGGCNMMLPSAVVKKVAAGNGIVECETCGRILIS